jgi:hypothetical protein
MSAYFSKKAQLKMFIVCNHMITFITNKVASFLLVCKWEYFNITRSDYAKWLQVNFAESLIANPAVRQVRKVTDLG